MHPIEVAVRRWLEDIVIGLNLCPFAARPVRGGQLRIVISEATDPLGLLTELQLELARLADTPAAALETTIIAIPSLLAEFEAYNDFLDSVDTLLDAYEWTGEYQVASFHPHYQFAGTRAEDPENLSNRSPVPLLHLLREASVTAAVDAHPDADGIPNANIRRLRAMDAEERRRVFAYLLADDPVAR